MRFLCILFTQLFSLVSTYQKITKKNIYKRLLQIVEYCGCNVQSNHIHVSFIAYS